jgi:alpha-tubulin suppressor-like RCC1 family protein
MMSTGRDHSIVLMSDGSVYGCGSNNFGQLATLSDDPSHSFVKIADINNAVFVACGSNSTFVIIENPVTGARTLKCFGRNHCGQLGLSHETEFTNQTICTPDFEFAADINRQPVRVVCSKSMDDTMSSTLVVMADGSMFGSGSNEFGQLGVMLPGNTLSNDIRDMMIDDIPPTRVYIPNNVFKFRRCNENSVTTPGKITALGMGTSHTIFVEDDIVYVVGSNNYMQLGREWTHNAHKPHQIFPVKHVFLTDIHALDPIVNIQCMTEASFVRCTSGKLYRFGRTIFMGLVSNDDTLTDTFAPEQNSNLLDPQKYSTLEYMFANVVCGTSTAFAYTNFTVEPHFKWELIGGVQEPQNVNKGTIPTKIYKFPPFNEVKTVSFVEHTHRTAFVLFSDNTLYSFGEKTYGNMGVAPEPDNTLVVTATKINIVIT